MTTAPWSGDARLRTFGLPHARWAESVQLWRPVGSDRLVTGAGETAALLLAGTFDLIGGGTAWPARGARTTPFAGRPMAVFLPPHTEFCAQNGHGEILLLAARQPAPPREVHGREAMAQKPLLPLAGSGKSFDPTAGEWRPAETFPTAPESLPPRRMQRLSVGALTVERVLAPDYKAATLSVDEVVVPAGGTLRIAEIPGRPRADEVIVFTRGEDGDTAALHGDVDGVCIAAGAAPRYVVLAYAGKGS
ncbi:MAG: 5-deoxy-glucuronate isomerase [Planctomycetes bacterium]|nr:5-deoxy-glucuronate isomerase [Planctomycetota bacterium]